MENIKYNIMKINVSIKIYKPYNTYIYSFCALDIHYL